MTPRAPFPIQEPYTINTPVYFQDVWVVLGNMDNTEGRGPEYPMYVCALEATALRLAKGKGVQGTDCPVRQNRAFRIEDQWYGPFSLQEPTAKDLEVAEQMSLQEQAANRARALGLTEEDLKLLSHLHK